MAIWAGETIQHGKQPGGLNDYFRVIFAMSGGKNSIDQEKKNSLGNHLGTWDFSYEKKYKMHRLTLNLYCPNCGMLLIDEMSCDYCDWNKNDDDR